MDFITALIAGFGLSAPAGLNAWLCLLIVGLLGRLTDLINLAPPFNALTEIWVLVVLGVLTTVEVFADKIPAVDTINDIINTLIRPLAGGVLFTAQATAEGGIDPTLGFFLGVLSAGGVHAVKATARPVVTATTAGMANPLVSLVEDIIAGVTTVLALIIAPLAAIIMIAFLALGFYAVWRLRAWRRRRNTTPPRLET